MNRNCWEGRCKNNRFIYIKPILFLSLLCYNLFILYFFVRLLICTACFWYYFLWLLSQGVKSTFQYHCGPLHLIKLASECFTICTRRHPCPKTSHRIRKNSQTTLSREKKGRNRKKGKKPRQINIVLTIWWIDCVFSRFRLSLLWLYWHVANDSSNKNDLVIFVKRTPSESYSKATCNLTTDRDTLWHVVSTLICPVSWCHSDGWCQMLTSCSPQSHWVIVNMLVLLLQLWLEQPVPGLILSNKRFDWS